MKLRQVKYFINQGARGITKNGLMSLASIGIVTASLAVFGLFFILGANINYIGSQIEEQCQLRVYLNPECDREDFSRIENELEQIPFVQSAEFVSKEEALNDFRRELQENGDVLDGLENDNPIRDSYILTLNDIKKTTEISESAKSITGVAEVVDRQETMQNIISLTDFFRVFTFWLLIILALISVFIISNTIKLGMFARRKEINIMKFVGATDWFIRWPFIIEGVLIGLSGAVVALIIIIWGYSSLFSSAESYFDILKILSLSDLCRNLLLSFIGIGIFIGAAGSFLSIRKYLKV